MNSSVSPKNTGDSLTAPEFNNILEAVNSKADQTALELLEQQIPGITAGLQPAITPASLAPTVSGLYPASESGTYSNFGSIVVDIAEGLTLIDVDIIGGTFTKILIPLELGAYVLKDDFIEQLIPALQYVVDNPPVQTTLAFGPTLPGTSNSTPNTSSNLCYFNTNSQITENIIVNKITFYSPLAGTMSFALGTYALVGEDNVFIRRVRTPEFTLVAGINVLNVNIPALKNEFLAVNGGTTGLKYGSGVPGNKFIDSRISGGGGGASSDGSYVALSFEGLTQRPDPLSAFVRVDGLASAVGPLVVPAIVGELTAPPVITYKSYGYSGSATLNGAFSSSNHFYYNELSVFEADLSCLSVVINANTAGTKYFTLGTPSPNGFAARKQLGPFSLAAGINTIVINEAAFLGETLALNGGSARIAYATGVTGSRFIDATTTAITASGSNIAIAFLINVSIATEPLGMLYTDSNVANKLLAYSTKDYFGPDKMIGTSDTATSHISLDGNTFYGAIGSVQKDSLIDKIVINAATAGTVVFSVITVDQYNFPIENRTISKGVSTGLNTLAVSEKLLAGQSLIIKSATCQIGFITNAAYQYWKSLTASYSDALTTVAGGALAFFYNYKEIVEKPFALASEYNDLNNKYNSLLALVESMLPPKIYDRTVGLGNSLMSHGIDTTLGWWGVWGMAATIRDNDLIHVLNSRLAINNPSITLGVRSINDFEAAITNDTGYDFSHWDIAIGSNLTESKAVLLRFGDNIRDNYDKIQARVTDAINYIKTNCTNPNNRIVVTGCWYASDTKDTAIEAACMDTGVPFVKISHLATEENKCGLGTIVQGDDGLSHSVFNSGVASHPGDKGHLAIAEEVEPKFKY